MEESNSLSAMAHIWQLLLRHARLFYPSKGQFVGQIAHNLAKLGLQANNPEHRRLALDLSKVPLRTAVAH